MASVRQLADLGLEALREGLTKLDRVKRQAPPTGDQTPDDDRPVHPDITATAELIGSLKDRAGRAGVSPDVFQDWLDAKQLALTGEGEPILSSQERGLLAKVFNEALAELKRAKAPASKSSRRKAATG